MVAVSIIQGVSMSIIGEKRLGKPPLPSGGLTTQPPYSTPMGYGVGGEGVVCTAMVGWMYTDRYLAVSGVSMVYIDSETLVGVYQTTIWYFPLVGLYTVLNRGVQ